MAVTFNMQSTNSYIVATILCVVASFGYKVCKAQEGANKIPELYGHVFIPNTLIVDPFNNTSMNINVGLGTTGEFKYPVFEIDGKTFYATRGQLLFVSVGLIYQQKIQDWASMYVRYFLSSRIGTNIGTILAQGFSTINAFQIGWKIRIAESNRYRFSTSFGISNYSGSFLSVTKLREDIIDEKPIPSLVTNIPALNGDLGFHFAYGISQLFGLNISFVNSIGESLERGQTTYLYSFGSGVDVNF